MIVYKPHVRALSVVVVAALASSVWAADAVDPALQVGHSPDGLSISAIDLQADAQRIPPEVRAGLLARPNNVRQQAENLLLRRVLAERARAEGMDQQPLTQALLRVAQDKILSDALLDYLDTSSRPDAEKAEGLARNIYNAQPERFAEPEQVQVRHILISGSDVAARAKAELLLKELKAGGDFAELAKKNSADPGSAAKGGDVGFFTKGRMVPEFEQTAFALKDGELSDVVQTQFGFHILQRMAYKPAGTTPYLEVRETLIREVGDKVSRDIRAGIAEAVRSKLQFDDAAIDSVVQDYAKQVQQ